MVARSKPIPDPKYPDPPPPPPERSAQDTSDLEAKQRLKFSRSGRAATILGGGGGSAGVSAMRFLQSSGVS